MCRPTIISLLSRRWRSGRAHGGVRGLGVAQPAAPAAGAAACAARGAGARPVRTKPRPCLCQLPLFNASGKNTRGSIAALRGVKSGVRRRAGGKWAEVRLSFFSLCRPLRRAAAHGDRGRGWPRGRRRDGRRGRGESVLGSWVGARCPFHLFLFLTAWLCPKILVLTRMHSAQGVAITIDFDGYSKDLGC